jgi:hypothetical protein
MPVIFDNGSEAIKTWLDPNRYEWTNELQSLLKPYEGELEIYPVNKDVGKVQNNSPSFIVPLDSAANKSNIVNFFGNHRKISKDAEVMNVTTAEENVESEGMKTEKQPEETRGITQKETTESNAPLLASPRGVKRERCDVSNDSMSSPPEKKHLSSPSIDRQMKLSPMKTPKKMKSATSNGSAGKISSPSKAAQGTQKITKFFGK